MANQIITDSNGYTWIWNPELITWRESARLVGNSNMEYVDRYILEHHLYDYGTVYEDDWKDGVEIAKKFEILYIAGGEGYYAVCLGSQKKVIQDLAKKFQELDQSDLIDEEFYETLKQELFEEGCHDVAYALDIFLSEKYPNWDVWWLSEDRKFADNHIIGGGQCYRNDLFEEFILESLKDAIQEIGYEPNYTRMYCHIDPDAVMPTWVKCFFDKIRQAYHEKRKEYASA